MDEVTSVIVTRWCWRLQRQNALVRQGVGVTAVDKAMLVTVTAMAAHCCTTLLYNSVALFKQIRPGCVACMRFHKGWSSPFVTAVGVIILLASSSVVLSLMMNANANGCCGGPTLKSETGFPCKQEVLWRVHPFYPSPAVGASVVVQPRSFW